MVRSYSSIGLLRDTLCDQLGCEEARAHGGSSVGQRVGRGEGVDKELDGLRRRGEADGGPGMCSPTISSFDIRHLLPLVYPENVLRISLSKLVRMYHFMNCMLAEDMCGCTSRWTVYTATDVIIPCLVYLDTDCS